MNVSSRRHKISKNYNKINDNSRVTYEIMTNIHVYTYEYKQNLINFNPNLQISEIKNF